MEEFIKRLKDNQDFKQLQAHILAKVDELNSVEDLEKMSNEEAGQTARVRALAASKLKEILAPFIDYREKREPTIEEIQAKKEAAGL